MSRKTGIGASALAFIGFLALAAPFAAHAGSAEEELMAADRAFNQFAQESGLAEAFEQFAAEDAHLISGSADPVVGPKAIYDAMLPISKFATLTWEPERAVASPDGKMGYTWGRFERHIARPDGTDLVGRGSYVTIWQRQADDTWKWIADIGSEALPQN